RGRPAQRGAAARDLRAPRSRPGRLAHARAGPRRDRAERAGRAGAAARAPIHRRAARGLVAPAIGSRRCRARVVADAHPDSHARRKPVLQRPLRRRAGEPGRVRARGSGASPRARRGVAHARDAGAALRGHTPDRRGRRRLVDHLPRGERARGRVEPPARLRAGPSVGDAAEAPRRAALPRRCRMGRPRRAGDPRAHPRDARVRRTADRRELRLGHAAPHLLRSAGLRAGFVHGIRFRLALAAMALLALPVLAAHFIASMESFLRASQEKAIGATARAVAAALSDRPTLFERGAFDDPEGEERRRIVALFAAADTDAAASLGNAYVPSDEIERFLAIMGRAGERVWVVDARSRVRGLSGSLADPAAARTLVNWLKPVAALVVPAPSYPVGDEALPVRGQIDRALIGVSSTQWRATHDRDVAILSAAQPIFLGDDIVGAVVVEETTGAIQILRQDALEKLLAVTLVVVAAALTVMLAFAGRLAARIRRLHAEAEAAIDAQ